MGRNQLNWSIVATRKRGQLAECEASVRSASGVEVRESGRCPMSLRAFRGELFRIKQSRVELWVRLDVGVFLGEHFLAIRNYFDIGGEPTSGQGPVVAEANVLEVLLVLDCGLDHA